MEFTKEQIKQGLDKAYKEAGHNAYFGNGFEAGIEFARRQLDPLNTSIIVSLPSDVDIVNKAIDDLIEQENEQSE